LGGLAPTNGFPASPGRVTQFRTGGWLSMKYIFVTGGVCSSLGKGVCAASIACLLEHAGFRVTLQKLDPYLNIDPGTMSPFQHGEVYVTDDGAETDLDLGTYERFTGQASFSRVNSVSTGQIYDTVIRRERAGGYLGKTVQIIPHITDEIKARIKTAGRGHEILIVEIGGTVGDIESVPFLEAIRQFAFDVGRENAVFIHLTLVPWLSAAGEAKTKPTQHSVKELMQIGIVPDILMCRTLHDLSPEMRDKLALFCNVDKDGVFAARNIDTTIYEIPQIYREEGLLKKVLAKLHLDDRDADLSEWNARVRCWLHPERETTIAVAGKYTEHQDAYKSIYEALMHAGAQHASRIRILRVDTELLEGKSLSESVIALDGLDEADGDFFGTVHGVLIPGGFGSRGVEGMVMMARLARERGIPCFGICLGMQVMAIDCARHLLGLASANSTEFDPATGHPVISLLEEQKKVSDMGGTMRLGSCDAVIIADTKMAQAYHNASLVSERHRHRYEFTSRYRAQFESAGVVFSAINPDNDLVEGIELGDHPWYLGVQSHPEFKSRLAAPAPLFTAFIGAAIKTHAT